MLKSCWRSWAPPGQASPVQCRFWPCLASLVAAILLLQLLHLALLSRLEGRGTQVEDAPSVLGRRAFASSVGRQLQGRTLATVLSEMEERVRAAHRLDKSGTYHLLDHFLPAELAPRGRAPYDVTLVTQCSSSRLSYLWELAPRWGGPASMAVFTWDEDFTQTASRLLHLHFCSDHVFRQVSFHLVYPISRAPGPEHLAKLSDIRLDCSAETATVFAEAAPPPANYAAELAYPNNLLRNLAINYAQTPYVFVVDADMLPSKNLRTEFQRFMLARSQGATNSPALTNITGDGAGGRPHDTQQLHKDHLSAFVVPAFELEDSAKAPSGKPELLELWRKGQVRPFYWDVCKRCQEPTEYDRWRGLPRSDTGGVDSRDVRVGYTVSHADPWEPFYIARTSLPLYDERFKQYGFNRISQICEMHVAGFSFHVLDNAFLLHRGFKRQAGFHSAKQQENDRNRLLFRRFKEELKVKYPDVTRRC